MKRKIMTVIIVAILFAVFALPVSSYAFGGHLCSGKMTSHYEGGESKFYKVAHKIIKKSKELELSEAQIRQIKDLKMEVKKSLINRDAKIKTLKVEINSLMWEFPFETEEVNELIAQQYKLKTEKAQYVVSAYEKLESILTDEQIAKMGSL